MSRKRLPRAYRPSRAPSDADSACIWKVCPYLLLARGALVHVFRSELQGYVQRSAGISHPLEGPPPTETSFASLEDDIKASQTASQAQLQVSTQSLTDEQLQRKDREITHIAQSITDLAQLFNEINDMVIDQGTMLDRIDYNIQNTSDNVQQANQELKIATTYQRRSSRRACIFLLLLVIFGMIVILLNKPRKQTSTP